ncbi:MAG: protein-glutamate O-methyltransferase CheR [Epsilonproteobacteria bacterium]|nr:MAG: protein-glutamate O-methyltransferase CheR [Campylobacterota bacterium]
MFNFFKKKKSVNEEVAVLPQEDFHNVNPIADYFHKETGITFDAQMSILKSKVTSFCKQRDIYSFSSLLQDIKIDTRLKQELIDYLTTNETYFYREFKQIQELVNLVKESQGSVKILCAPSATGEEVYSIAIALLEAGVASSKFYILGIDINSDAILKAQNAVYGERNVRNLTPQVISKYFDITDKKYTLKQNIKSLVSFQQTNIFDSSFKNIGKFDFIFSRNMLIYFDKETKLKAKGILESLRKSDQHDIFFGHADLF